MCEKTPSNSEYFEEVDRYLNENGNIKNVHFVPIKMPESSKKYTKLHDIGFWPAYYWGYKCWHKDAYRKAMLLHSENRFDLAYQLNMIGFREPGYLWKLDIPFVWGPTNGFHSIPFSYIKGFKVKELIVQSLKHIANELQIKLSIRARKAAKKANIVWCVDNTAFKKMSSWSANAELMQETGLNSLPENLKTSKNYDGVRCLNLVWSGMVTPGKALEILIKALINLQDLNFHLTVLGDGPTLLSIRKLAKPIQDKITFAGWLSKSKAIDVVIQSDLLIHTSLKEGTTNSILEALGMGVPVICHDTCGMGVVINNLNGFKIPYSDFATSIKFLTDLLNRITENPNLLNDRYKTIWETTNDLAWDNKVNLIAKKIENILE